MLMRSRLCTESLGRRRMPTLQMEQRGFGNAWKRTQRCLVRTAEVGPARRKWQGLTLGFVCDSLVPRLDCAIKGSFGMNNVIIQALLERRRLQFTYNEKARLAEPQCYGIGAKGTELLRVHQIRGGSQREPLFDVAKMSNVVLLEEVFARPGPNYKRNDSAMKIIICQL